MGDTDDDRLVLGGFLAAGADIHVENSQGHTPLYTACLHNHIDVAELLISRGSDTSAITPDVHWLSLMFAALNFPAYQYYSDSFSRLRLAQLLLSHGANVQAATPDGSTALHKAAHSGDAELVRHLIEHGADVGATTATG